MLEFIGFIIGLLIGGLFGVTAMCCLQINRINSAARRKEENNEKEKY